MSSDPSTSRPGFEQRLERLREEAHRHGVVEGGRIRAAGGPLPSTPATPERMQASPGYYGLALLKPPVWKWMIALYFFVGGLAGMAGLLAAAALMQHDWRLVRLCLWLAAGGAILSPVLLTWDLGRPWRFLAMLRVFKIQSPMSVGSWIVAAFGAASIPGVALVEWHLHLAAAGGPVPLVHGLAIAAVLGSGFFGILLATYTGALIGATAIPAWNLHHVLLPFHFGMAGLGSAAALAELCGFRTPALNATGYIAAAAETLVLLWLETHRHGAADHALHAGGSGWTLRLGEILEGPAPLALRLFGGTGVAAVSFLVGALATRFGWLAAGRRSARDPASVFAAQAVPAAAAKQGNPS